MPLIMLKCNGCGGTISLDANKNIGFCPYCGAKFIKETPINNYTTNITNNVTNTFKGANVTIVADDIEKKIDAANTFLQLGQNIAAEKKFGEIIDSHPHDHRGWWGAALAKFGQLKREGPIPLPSDCEPEYGLRIYESSCRCIEDYFNKALSMCKDDTIKQQITSHYNGFIAEKNRVVSDYRQRKSNMEIENTKRENKKTKKRSTAWLTAFLIIYIPVFFIINLLADSFLGSALLGLVVAGILFLFAMPIIGSIIRETE